MMVRSAKHNTRKGNPPSISGTGHNARSPKTTPNNSEIFDGASYLTDQQKFIKKWGKPVNREVVR